MEERAPEGRARAPSIHAVNCCVPSLRVPPDVIHPIHGRRSAELSDVEHAARRDARRYHAVPKSREGSSLHEEGVRSFEASRGDGDAAAEPARGSWDRVTPHPSRSRMRSLGELSLRSLGRTPHSRCKNRAQSTPRCDGAGARLCDVAHFELRLESSDEPSRDRERARRRVKHGLGLGTSRAEQG